MSFLEELTVNSTEKEAELVRASILLTTTAHPTALAEAGTSYSHIAVNIGSNFIELEINNAVEIIFPLFVISPFENKN